MLWNSTGPLLKNLEAVRPGIEILCVSSKTGSGMDAWLRYLVTQRNIQPRSALKVPARGDIALAAD